MKLRNQPRKCYFISDERNQTQKNLLPLGDTVFFGGTLTINLLVDELYNKRWLGLMDFNSLINSLFLGFTEDKRFIASFTVPKFSRYSAMFTPSLL